jgi:hypothetical protein
VTLPRPALVWFGVLGAPVAWVLQHVAGYALSEADCNRVGRMWNVPLDTLVAVITVLCAAIAVLGGLAALASFRATRAAGEGGPPPAGRVHFMAIAGMVVAVLMLAIILLDGIGVLAVEGCRQG